jgi:hypothetical protein
MTLMGDHAVHHREALAIPPTTDVIYMRDAKSNSWMAMSQWQ